jgi:integrase
MADITKRVLADGTTTYRVRIRLRGTPIQSATFCSLTKAKLWAQSTEAAIREGRHFATSASKKHTCGEMIDRYIAEILPLKPKSKPKQTSQLLWWKEQIGYVLLAQLTPSLIAQQRDKLLSGTTYRHTQRSPATVIRYLAALSHVITVAHEEWEWIAHHPMSKITRPKEPRGRVRFLSPEEREQLLQACSESASPLLLPIVVLALSTGMRQNEILGLTWQDVDLARGRALLHETKNGERRVITIAGRALKLLQELAAKRDPARGNVTSLPPGSRLSTHTPFLRRRWLLTALRQHPLRTRPGDENAHPASLARPLSRPLSSEIIFIA